MKRAIVVDPRDDVAVVVESVAAGEAVEAQSAAGSQTVIARQDIPLGHKIALRDVAAGDPVLKYGERIGRASVAIRRGDYVHVHNLASDRAKAHVP